jgi:outer membrane protein/protease secretion system outer membrane protein
MSRLIKKLPFAFVAVFLAQTQAFAIDLLQSYERALVEDAQYLAALSAADAGRELESIAVARLLPNLSVRAHRFENDLNTRNGSRSFNSDYPSTNAVISLSQPLYRPREFAGYRQSLAQVAGVEARLDLAEQDLVLRLTQAYFEIVLANEAEQAVIAEQKAIEIQLAAAKKALVAGQGTRTDIDDAQARLDLSEAKLIAARQRIDHARHILGNMINQDIVNVSALDPIKMLLTKIEQSDLDEWIERAVQANPELNEISAQQEAARSEVDRAKAGHKPTVDLILQRSYSESDNVTNPNTRYLNNQIGIQLSMPIFAGGGVSAEVRKASHAWEEAKSKYEAARRTLSAEVRKEFQAVIEGVQKIHAYEQALKSAEQAVISNEKGVLAGLRSRVDVLDASQERANVRLELEKERVKYVLARMRLRALAGELTQADVEELNSWLAR